MSTTFRQVERLMSMNSGEPEFNLGDWSGKSLKQPHLMPSKRPNYFSAGDTIRRQALVNIQDKEREEERIPSALNDFFTSDQEIEPSGEVQGRGPRAVARTARSIDAIEHRAVL